MEPAGQSVTNLARRMRQLTSWIESQEGVTAERQEFDRPPFGDAYMTLDVTSVAPAASFNRNRICLCGADGGLTREGMHELVQKFVRRDIPRVFVWLSPGPGDAEVREWLRELTFVRVPWTRYPTMLFGGVAAPVARPGTFEIRQIGVAAFAAAKTVLGETVMDGYAHTLESPGFHHYVMYDRARPIAVAALVKFDEIGYLTYAGTVETDRRRGAQSLLIAHRVAVAQSLGCTHIVSQTLTMLEDSFANLQREGFREIYEQEVYVLERG